MGISIAAVVIIILSIMTTICCIRRRSKVSDIEIDEDEPIEKAEKVIEGNTSELFSANLQQTGSNIKIKKIRQEEGFMKDLH